MLRFAPFTFKLSATALLANSATLAKASTLKEATLETGAIIMVPLFINQGEKIRVNTTDRSYGERVK